MSERYESDPKSKLVAAMRTHLSGYVVIRHEEKARSGVPDISVTGYGKTSWIEVKYADPSFTHGGVQDITMRRLAGAGIAFYVIFYESRERQRTYIVEPRYLDNWENQPWFNGFDYHTVVNYVKKIHEPPNLLSFRGRR